ncbi:MFS transporter [Promicromonospora panici]|uniref:MFS transporter n=1 Tax=Promicromonospora panici TaxID=2219658 RepID=UPI0013ED2BCF|nr:MFS transporter [Promicromonospora panici]
MLTTLGPLSIDLYLPAFPALREEFGADDGAVQLTLAGMTVGLALRNLVTGAWSDRVGRRRPLLLATALHVVVTVACAVAPNLEVLAILRVVQGVAAAGSSVLVLAIARDVSDERRHCARPPRLAHHARHDDGPAARAGSPGPPCSPWSAGAGSSPSSPRPSSRCSTPVRGWPGCYRASGSS